jgi:hypothetical protein
MKTLRSVVRSVLASFFVGGPTRSFGQATPPAAPPNPVGGNEFIFNPITDKQFWILVLAVGLAVILFLGQIFLLLKAKSITGDDIIKNVALIAVIFGAIILIIAGYNSQQTAPAFGLFGTLIGYLLGRSASRYETAAQRRDDEEAPQ